MGRWPNNHLAAHTAQPGSLPRILQQTLCPGRCFIRPGPCAVLRDLIVLKHSSYHLIFQCPLSLVSNLHICWNTVGCLLFSSDQLGISLALRGSGLLSHLSRRHLPRIFFILIFLLLFNYSCMPFLPIPPPHPRWTHLPPPPPPSPLVLSMCPL